MCFFDCKCKSFNRLGENRKNRTCFSPPLDREKKYLSGSGWMSCIFVCLFFSKVFCCCLFLLEFVRLYMQKLTKTRQNKKRHKKNTKRKKKNKTFKKNLQEKNTARAAGTWEMFIRGRVVGWWMSCIFVMFVFLEGRFVFSVVVCVFLPGLFECLHV